MTDSSSLKQSDESPIWHRLLPVTLVVCFGTIFSLTIFGVLRSWERKDAQKAFLLAAEDRAMAVKGTFNTESAMLELVRSALTTDDRIECREFSEILGPFLSRSKSIQAVEWVPRVLDGRRKEFEQAAIKDGIKGFQIKVTDASGKFVESPRRDEYFPIYYIGPQQSDMSIFGYDLGSEPTRLKAVTLARDTGQTVASGRFSFVNEPESEGGFFVAMPVYERGRQTKTVAQRRQYFMGVVLGLFRPNDMIHSAIGKLQTEGIDVGLYDPSEGEKSLFYRASRTRDMIDEPLDPKRLLDDNGERFVVSLDLAGHPWTVVCAPTPEFKTAHRTLWPMAGLTAGLVFTLMAAGYLYSSIGRSAQLEEKVQEQTADIRKAQEDVLDRLASASQWRGDETAMHIRRIGLLSHALARAADWFGDDLDAIRQAAPMHDIGKIGIPDAILSKGDKLTPQEAETLKTHTRIGAEILAGSDVPMLKMARDIAANHHEQWDGLGYPRGLAEHDIPDSARIVAIVDTFDMLTHEGLNRPAMSEADALATMRSESGKKFDPVLLATFFRNIGELHCISERFPDGNRTGVHKAGLEATLPPSIQTGTMPESYAPV